MAVSPRVYQFLVSIFASLGSLLYGYDLGVVAEVVAAPSFLAAFGDNTTKTGLVVSLFTVGAFFGAFWAGPCGDYLGRKWTIFIGGAIFILGGSVQTAAQDYSYMFGGRFVAGLGVGALIMIIPLYQAELAHPSIRGRITALQQFMLGVGNLIAAWVSYRTYVSFDDDNSAQWRIGLGLQLLPAVFLTSLILLFPESPRWLIHHGRSEEGLKVLAKLHASGNDQDSFVQEEYDAITAAVEYEKEHAAKSYAELFKTRSSFRRLITALSLQASVQMSGVSAIQYYSPDIYGQIGISGSDTFMFQGFNAIVALAAQFCCMLFIDRVGRRWTLIGGNLLNMVTFIIATALLASYPPGASTNKSAQEAFIAMTWLFNFSYSVACGPLSWIIPAEIFDTHTRSKGVSLATACSFAFNTMIGQVSPIALERIGWKFYILFVVCSATNALWFWATLPETAKRPLEDMGPLFQKLPWFVPGKAKISLQQLWGDEWKENAGEIGKVEEKELKIETAED
ncbi:MFS transporter, partial [Aureobasidium melanogenum]